MRAIDVICLPGLVLSVNLWLIIHGICTKKCRLPRISYPPPGAGVYFSSSLTFGAYTFSFGSRTVVGALRKFTSHVYSVMFIHLGKGCCLIKRPFSIRRRKHNFGLFARKAYQIRAKHGIERICGDRWTWTLWYLPQWYRHNHARSKSQIAYEVGF